MECTITFTKQVRARGIALAEMMLSLGIGGLLLSAVAAQMFHTGRSFAAVANYVDLDNSSRSALDKMSSEIRQANRLTSFSTTQLQFETVDAMTGATNALTYTYDPAAGTLRRTYSGQTTTVLQEVLTNSLHFAMFQRNPVGGSVDQYPTTDPTQCKVIQLSWICSRKIFGRAADTESVQSAKIVIRKE